MRIGFFKKALCSPVVKNNLGPRGGGGENGDISCIPPFPLSTIQYILLSLFFFFFFFQIPLLAPILTLLLFVIYSLFLLLWVDGRERGDGRGNGEGTGTWFSFGENSCGLCVL